MLHKKATMLRYAIFFVWLMVNIECFTPNCVRENQFKFYTFPVEGCSSGFSEMCRSHPQGYLKALGNVFMAKIGRTEIVPTCAFNDIYGLMHILGVNSDIKVLATNAFTNLVDLKTIQLAFNSIREIRKDVFRNVSAEFVDLSWNKLVFIDSEAFAQMWGLKHLNLSRNFLQTLSINTLSKSVLSLNLSYNLLDRLALNSRNFINLTALDLSNNLLDKLAIMFSYPVKLIDLTNNRLENFDYIETESIDLFKIGGNRFERVPNYMENLNAKVIDIYPNPWICQELFFLWAILTNFNIKLPPKVAGKTSLAECASVTAKLKGLNEQSPPCADDHECPDDMVCRAKKCCDPCKSLLCHESSVCKTRNHKFECKCPEGLLRNPLDMDGQCQRVDCFMSIHCRGARVCLDGRCLSIILIQGHPGSSLPEPTIPEYPWWYDDIPKIRPCPKRLEYFSFN